MSTAATMQQTPAIPPRPSRSQEDKSSVTPSIPPRPTKRFNRSVSPNPDRFAPSPLNELHFNPKSPGRRTSGSLNVEPIERPGSVSIPSIGQEGQEYAAFDDLASSPEDHRTVSPEQTRTIGEDIKLHAPKPKLAQEAAVQRVAAVTRTDSDRAAQFGIGRPSSEDPYPRSLKKKASTTSQLSHISHDAEDEHGIPEIGQRVPLLGNAGDIQAPTPAPGASGTPDTGRPGSRHHTRRTSGRSQFGHLPSDSYGLHGHGVENNDKLEKAYYEKHPEAKKFDLYNHHLHDRVKDYSMSSEELNKLVRDSEGAGLGTNREYISTPSEQVGFEATDEYVSRNASPRPPSAASKRLSQVHADSPLKNATGPDISVSAAEGELEDDDVIHVDEPGRRKGFAKYGDAQQVTQEGTEDDYEAPILASDETAKRRSLYDTPAVEPPVERRGSSYEMEQPKSRPTSRAANVLSPPPEIRSEPLDDVEEYEPLFPEDEKSQKKAAEKAEKRKSAQRFPSRDIWEDAPDSVHGTAEVSTPEPSEGSKRPDATDISDIVPREGETIAQAFARRQEELAEAEDRSPDSFMRQNPRSGSRPRSWIEAQPHLAKEMNQSSRPANRRFPSRDVWEDTPDSLRLETTVSTPQSEKDPQSATAEESPVEKLEKPSIPARPVKKLSGDDKPTIPDRPKPQIPARPGKSSAETKELEAAPRQKPAVPARPVGGKIAALQAGFMSDLNKRLQLGPQAPKKEEPKEEEPAEEKEKAPLSDARKGRARGPQRRAPTKSSSPGGAAPASNGKPVLSFSMTRTLWCIDEEGTMNVQEEDEPSEAHSNQVVEPQHSRELASNESHEPLETEENSNEPTETTAAPSTTTGSDTKAETKTLATNTAGDSILQDTLDKKSEGDQVADVEEVKDQGLDS